MADYISREAALACFHDWIDHYGHEHTADEMTEYQRIEELPAADVRPVVRGEWEPPTELIPVAYDIAGVITWASEMRCSKCGFSKKAIEGRISQYNFCPSCGADMRPMEECNNG